VEELNEPFFAVVVGPMGVSQTFGLIGKNPSLYRFQVAIPSPPLSSFKIGRVRFMSAGVQGKP